MTLRIEHYKAGYAEDQAKIHKARGWKTDEQVLKSEGDEVLQFIQREIERELGG